VHLKNPVPVARDARSAPDTTLRPSEFKSRNRAFAEPDALLFRYGSKDSDHGVTEHAAGIQVLLCERPEADTVGCQALKMLQRLEHALSTESVQCPKKNGVKLAAGCGGEHLLELVSIGTLPGGTILVLPDDVPVLFGAELSQLAQLVLGVLFVSLAHPRVDGDLR